jgi:flagellar hook-associated protein 2
MDISTTSSTSNPLLSYSLATSNPLASASSTTSNPLLVNNYPTTTNSAAQQTAGEQILTQLGGSSINLLGIEASLISAAREPQQTIINSAVQSLYNAQTSLSSLNQGLTALQSAADSLNNVSALNQLQFSDTDGAVSASAGGIGAAIQGSHQITIYKMAAGQESQSQSFSSATTSVSSSAYTLSLVVAGNTTNITVPAGQSLTQVASLINAQNIGVSAQVINSGTGSNPYSLLLTGNTGAASSFTATGGPLNFSSSLQQSTSYQSQSAVPQADAFNIAITSSTASSNPTTIQVKSNSTLPDIVNAINTQTSTTQVTAQLIKTNEGTYAVSLTGPSGADASYSVATSSVNANTSYSYASAATVPDTAAFTLNVVGAQGGPAGGTISIAANSSLSDIATAINNSSAGVTASVATDANGQSYLSVVDSTSQATNTFSITSSSSTFLFNSGSSTPNMGFAGKNVQDAQDASFSVDSIQYTRPKNTVADVLAGVTLTLNGVNTGYGTGVSTLGVNYDTSSISTAISNFVTAFNNYQSFVSTTTGQTSTTDNQAGSLQQYPEINADLQKIASLLVNPSSSASNNIKTWADIGVSIQVNGQLQFSQATFMTAFNSAPSDVITALSNNAQTSPSAYSGSANGLAGDISVSVQKMMATSGTVANVNSQITSGMAAEQSQQDALNLHIQNLQSQYDAQFSSLQAILSEFSATSSQLQQTYNPTKNSSG